MYKILENKGFSIIDKFDLEDIYFIKKEINIKNNSINEILKEYILIRKVTQFIPDNFKTMNTEWKLTLKRKNILTDGTIINQEKIDCEIQNVEQGKKFLEAIGYKNIMTIKEKDIVYGKEDLKLAIKNIENSDNLLEIETVENNTELNTIDKLKDKLNELQIPINTDNYFVKKAEIELKKAL